MWGSNGHFTVQLACSLPVLKFTHRSTSLTHTSLSPGSLGEVEVEPKVREGTEGSPLCWAGGMRGPTGAEATTATGSVSATIPSTHLFVWSLGGDDLRVTSARAIRK